MSEKTFKVWFRRRPDRGEKEVGPIDVFDEISARSLTAARKAAKRIAKEKGWRFMEIWAAEDAAQISAQSPVSAEILEKAVVGVTVKPSLFQIVQDCVKDEYPVYPHPYQREGVIIFHDLDALRQHLRLAEDFTFAPQA